MYQIEEPHHDPWWVWPLLAALLIGSVGGVVAAVWTENPAWLLASVGCFCVMYAG